ncbi:MAG: sulfatase-like hydrolase/transferase, partial [Planctomycetota bacterium]
SRDSHTGVGRRDFLKALGLGTLALASGRKASGAGKKKRPNVVILFTDDQGTLDAGCYGSKDLYTPAMDELARTGVRFTQAYAHTVCCPARALLMTGRHPQRSGVNTWMQANAKDARRGANMLREEVTIAEALRAAGYRTGLFGKWHLGAHFDHGPTEQGFDEFVGIRDGFIDNYNHYFLHGKGFHDLYEGREEIFAKGKYFPDLMTARALEFIETNKDRPFFMYVAFNIPHYPEQADSKFDERYKDMKMPRRSYAKMISTTDDRMGIVVAKLEALGLREDTIVIFMSDNGHSREHNSIRMDNHNSGLAKGTYYGAHGGGGNTGKWRGHKGTFYEGGIRVPAVVSYPAKLPKGVVRDQAITAADWFPTIMALCSLPLPEVTLDGRSLLPIIKSADAPTHHKVMHWQWQSKWAVREGPWKLIGRSRKPEFLGSLDDPRPETKNYIKEKPDIAARLKKLHDEWAKDVRPGR